MTKQLILRIDPAWPATPSARWALLDERGQMLGEGESEARHWPAAESCCVVLAGAQCLWLEATLPRAARRDEPRLLAYALEDRLLEDPEREHLTVSHRRRHAENGGECLGVVAVDRDRLRQVLAQLAAIGRVPTLLCPEFPAKSDAEHWQIVIDGAQAILVAGPGNAAALDVAALLVALEQQVAAARLNGALPKSIELRLAVGATAPQQLDEACPGIDLQRGATYVWWQIAAQSAAVNLLHDEIASKTRANYLKRFKWPLWLAGGAFALWLLGGTGEVLWQRQTLSSLDSRMERTYLSTFPGNTAVAPATQMQQRLSLERGRHGLLKNDDLLALLACVVDVLGDEAAGSFGEVRYADGLLELSLKGALAGRAATFPARFAGSGLLTEVRNENGGVRLRVRLGDQP
ncbi:MAG: hypothetical protein J0L95_17595 [Candidatus Accumulibacter sp.]|jgi:general secretion pathway protein L|uniref:type II secretion system protein GspL n=1 Tax=Accumulibacter sp. TaxID=2053492 RepID=UPI001ACAADCB|nr:type II secretion system protein GspL [Accumulibacter sp.]MBN8439830.1 hypothetical protein [Accumulibacter sp.]